MKLISLKSWMKFPQITLTSLVEDQVQEIEWEGVVVKLGDKVIWINDYDDGLEFTIDAIRLAPTLRFWSQERGGWFLACDCKLVK